METYTVIIIAVTAVVAILVGLGIGFVIRKNIEATKAKKAGSTAESLLAEAEKKGH